MKLIQIALVVQVTVTFANRVALVLPDLDTESQLFKKAFLRVESQNITIFYASDQDNGVNEGSQSDSTSLLDGSFQKPHPVNVNKFMQVGDGPDEANTPNVMNAFVMEIIAVEKSQHEPFDFVFALTRGSFVYDEFPLHTLAARVRSDGSCDAVISDCSRAAVFWKRNAWIQAIQNTTSRRPSACVVPKEMLPVVSVRRVENEGFCIPPENVFGACFPTKHLFTVEQLLCQNNNTGGQPAAEPWPMPHVPIAALPRASSAGQIYATGGPRRPRPPYSAERVEDSLLVKLKEMESRARAMESKLRETLRSVAKSQAALLHDNRILRKELMSTKQQLSATTDSLAAATSQLTNLRSAYDRQSEALRTCREGGERAAQEQHHQATEQARVDNNAQVTIEDAEQGNAEKAALPANKFLWWGWW